MEKFKTRKIRHEFDTDAGVYKNFDSFVETLSETKQKLSSEVIFSQFLEHGIAQKPYEAIIRKYRSIEYNKEQYYK